MGVDLPLKNNSLMVRWVVGSILHDEPIELFLVPDIAKVFTFFFFFFDAYIIAQTMLIKNLKIKIKNNNRLRM